MTDVSAPRGYVPMSDFVRQERQIERLREELEYARWLLGQGDEDQAIVNIVSRRMRVGPRDARLLMRLVRAYPRVVPQRGEKDKQMICAIRKAIHAAGGNARALKTMWGVGYVLSAPAIAWLKTWAPELFTPPAQVMRQYVGEEVAA